MKLRPSAGYDLATREDQGGVDEAEKIRTGPRLAYEPRWSGPSAFSNGCSASPRFAIAD